MDRLSREEFAYVVRIVPLVSIDLIVRDTLGRVLLGRRNFEPAKDFYFVPGGRILKGESIRIAFSRIARDELGLALSIEDARFLGPYEHFHPTSRYESGVTTHYIVLAYEVHPPSIPPNLTPDEQHSMLVWRSEDEILRMPEVHELTKAYFAPRQVSG